MNSDAISRYALEQAIRKYADQKHFAGHVDLANGILKSLAIIEAAPALPVRLAGPQKPLTLQKLHKLIRAGEDVAIYCEAKDDDHTYATILYDGYAVNHDCTKIRTKSLVFENYGIAWRAWAQRPTDEERAAAPWEEDDNADL